MRLCTLTILIENLVGTYLGGKAVSAIAQYGRSQPGAGAGVQICDTPVR
jgi:hypothetical protein